MRAIAIASVLAVTATATLAGDTRQYDFDDFNEIEVSAGVSVIIESGKNYSIEAEAIRGNLRRLKINQSGDTLEIDRKTSWGILGVGRRDRFEVTITLPELSYAKASSGSSMEIDGPFNDDLALEVSSGADLSFVGNLTGDLEVEASSGASVTVTGISSDSVDAQASSGSSLSLEGTCQSIEADSSSGSALTAERLECVEGDAHSSSGSSLSIFTSGKIKAKSSGGASLSVLGSPPVAETSRSGSGSVSVR